MAELEVSTSPASYSISKFISKLRRRASTLRRRNQNGRLLDPRPPLIESHLPLVLSEHQHLLPTYGWTTITLPASPIGRTITSPSSTTSLPPPTHPLQHATLALFAAGQSFFSRPAACKYLHASPLASEEGYTCIPHEKEFITLRTLAQTPEVLREPVRRFWDLAVAHLDASLGRLSAALGLPDGEEEGLRRYVGLCRKIGIEEHDRYASMVRIFRYECHDTDDEAEVGLKVDPNEEEGIKVVAEAHADLGLLSLVIGDVPGLEVWGDRGWFAVEKAYEAAQVARTAATARHGKATVLAGRQLELLTNGRIVVGGHRVVSYPSTERPPSHHHHHL